jgi:hypothetical protein
MGSSSSCEAVWQLRSRFLDPRGAFEAVMPLASAESFKQVGLLPLLCRRRARLLTDDSLSVFVEHGEYASTILDLCVAVEGDVAEERPSSPGVTNSSNFSEDGGRLASCSSYLSSRGEGY